MIADDYFRGLAGNPGTSEYLAIPRTNLAWTVTERCRILPLRAFFVSLQMKLVPMQQVIHLDNRRIDPLAFPDRVPETDPSWITEKWREKSLPWLSTIYDLGVKKDPRINGILLLRVMSGTKGICSGSASESLQALWASSFMIQSDDKHTSIS